MIQNNYLFLQGGFMATFIISTVCSGGYFGCMITVMKESLTNPEDINLYANNSILAYSAKTKISKNIYSDSILRSIDTYASFASDANRFCVEYGVYATLKFVESKMKYGDSVVIAGVPYVKPLARGILETVEDFEVDFIKLCYSKHAMFTNTLFQCGLKSKFDQMNVSQYIIANPNDYRWIEQ